MILLYRVLTTLIYPFLVLFSYYRLYLGKEDPVRFKEKIFVSNFKIKDNNLKLNWFHAASIGEFKSIIPIIEYLNTKDNNLNFLITTSSVSSGHLATQELKRFNNAQHRFFPYDVPFLIDKFLKLWKPEKIFLVDSEIWPNLILKAHKYNIPVALINARITKKSFKRWIIFPKVAKKIFSKINLCLCSNMETKEFLSKLCCKNIYFRGNLKLIGKINEENVNNINESFLLKKRFWFAASTHKGEDILCIKTHLKLKSKFSDIVTVIAPRHIERSHEIKELAKKFNLRVQVLNHDEYISKDNEIVIINHFGALLNYFKYAKSVFIGKSMIKKLKDVGGQNPIEAAKLRCKIYHGPFVYNFEEIYKILQKFNISKKIENFQELSNYLIDDLKDSNKFTNQSPDAINNLGQKTLSDTMIIIDNFLNDKFS